MQRLFPVVRRSAAVVSALVFAVTLSALAGCASAWVRYYVDHSRTDIYDWVTDLGVRFEAVGAAPGNSVEREHQPSGRGIGLVTPIYRECLELPSVRFVWNAKAVQLMQSGG